MGLHTPSELQDTVNDVLKTQALQAEIFVFSMPAIYRDGSIIIFICSPGYLVQVRQGTGDVGGVDW